jgi:hypothetical protein
MEIWLDGQISVMSVLNGWPKKTPIIPKMTRPIIRIIRTTDI